MTSRTLWGRSLNVLGFIASGAGFNQWPQALPLRILHFLHTNELNDTGLRVLYELCINPLRMKCNGVSVFFSITTFGIGEREEQVLSCWGY